MLEILLHHLLPMTQYTNVIFSTLSLLNITLRSIRYISSKTVLKFSILFAILSKRSLPNSQLYPKSIWYKMLLNIPKQHYRPLVLVKASSTKPHALIVHQKNVMAKRKHCILLDITLALFNKVHIPHCVVQHHHNRHPSSPLEGATPLRCLFHDVNLFALSPRVVGCMMFIRSRTPSLVPWIQKGVFVTFFIQKGYHGYFHSTRQYIILANFTFHEDDPYLSLYSYHLRAYISPPMGFPSTRASSPYPWWILCGL